MPKKPTYEELEQRIRDLEEECAINRRTDEALQAYRAKLEAALDSMTDAVFISDGEGHFVNFNGAFATFHRFKDKDECPKTLPEYPTILDVYMADGTLAPLDMWAVPRALRGEKATNVEYTLRRKDTGERWIGSYNFAPIRDAGGVIVGSVVVGRDITARKQVESTLEKVRFILSEGQKIAHLGTFEYVVETQTTVWSEEEYRIYGLDPRGRSPAYDVLLKKCIHPDDAALLHQTFTAAMQNGGVYELEHRIVRPDGNVRWVYNRAHPYFDKNSKLVRYIGATLDITERKQAEEVLQQSEKKLRFLSSHLLIAQEAERNRISKELHDQLGQDLIGVKLHVGSIQRELSEGKIAFSHEFRSVQDSIDRIIENVRRLSRDLGPYALEHLGLWQALRYLTEEMTKYYLVKTSFDIVNSDNWLPQNTQLNIFRVFQEALTNIQKHADATHVSIEVSEKDGNFFFLIEDDGKGFDLAQGRRKNLTEKGLGLVIMEERIRMLEGAFDIWSQRGKGTRISFTVPVDREGKQKWVPME